MKFPFPVINEKRGYDHTIVIFNLLRDSTHSHAALISFWKSSEVYMELTVHCDSSILGFLLCLSIITLSASLFLSISSFHVHFSANEPCGWEEQLTARRRAQVEVAFWAVHLGGISQKAESAGCALFGI